MQVKRNCLTNCFKNFGKLIEAPLRMHLKWHLWKLFCVFCLVNFSVHFILNLVWNYTLCFSLEIIYLWNYLKNNSIPCKMSLVCLRQLSPVIPQYIPLEIAHDSIPRIFSLITPWAPSRTPPKHHWELFWTFFQKFHSIFFWALSLGTVKIVIGFLQESSQDWFRYTIKKLSKNI